MKSIFIGDEDLDLGIYYEMKDGTKSLIDPVQFNKRGGAQNMQTKQGCFTQFPYVWHQGDDRGAAETSCERIYVNPKGLKDIKKLSTFHKNHSACDSAYGWNFKWTSGTK